MIPLYFRTPALATIVAFLAFATWSRAQEEKLALTPPLSQVVPLELEAQGVHLKFPILLNDRTIVNPGAILRFVYIDPNAYQHGHGAGGGGGGGQGGGGAGGHGSHHRGGSSGDGDDGGNASTRSGPSPATGGDDGTPPADTGDGAKGPSGEARTEVWTQLDLFRDALDNAADVGTTLVYSLADPKKPLSAVLDLPDGMLLGEVDGHVRVLGLTAESQALESGVRPDDEIRSFAGTVAVNSLRDFTREYSEIKASGKSYAVQVWRPSDAKLVTIQVGAPPSLPKLF